MDDGKNIEDNTSWAYDNTLRRIGMQSIFCNFQKGCLRVWVFNDFNAIAFIYIILYYF